MVKRGPKNQVEYQADAATIPGSREPAPIDLELEAVALWNEIVIRLPEDWFTTENRPLLKAYCRHSHYADRFARDITATRAAIEAIEASGNKAGLKKLPKLREHFIALHRMHGAETDHMIKCATKLRLTNQSRYVRETAASKARSAGANSPPPWYDWGRVAQHAEV